MADIKLVADAMFYKKENWVNIPDVEKESCFFIFNRYFSKKYPDKSQLLNSKNIDKITAMDIWFHFMKNKPYPRWFWSKSPSKLESKISDKDIKELLKILNIKKSDLDFLVENNYDFIKDEIKYYKSLEKQNK